MEYRGRAQFGDGDRAVEAVVRIGDLEDVDWSGSVVPLSTLPRGEVSVTLLDGGPYNAWRGSAVLVRKSDERVQLLGHLPFSPPVGG